MKPFNCLLASHIILSFCIILIIGCCKQPFILDTDNIGKRTWTPESVIQWFEMRQSNLEQISAYAKINITAEKKEKSFDVVFSLLNQGVGRIDGIGPLNASLFHLIFNKENIFCYIPNDSVLYYCQNSPNYLEKLLGIPFDISTAFNLLTYALPIDITPCDRDVHQDTCNDMCLMVEQKGRSCKAYIKIEEYPMIKTLNCKGIKTGDDLFVRYEDPFFTQNHQIPKKIMISLTNDSALNIEIKSIKVNQKIKHMLFIPDEDWFSGEVISLNE